MVVVDVIMIAVVVISAGLLAFNLTDAWRPEKYYGENADALSGSGTVTCVAV